MINKRYKLLTIFIMKLCFSKRHIYRGCKAAFELNRELDKNVKQQFPVWIFRTQNKHTGTCT